MRVMLLEINWAAGRSKTSFFEGPNAFNLAEAELNKQEAGGREGWVRSVMFGPAELVAGEEAQGVPEQVWQNECRLVLGQELTHGGKLGQMGLCHPSGEEIQLDIISFDKTGKHEIFEKLKNIPVRVTIERVPGGRA